MGKLATADAPTVPAMRSSHLPAYRDRPIGTDQQEAFWDALVEGNSHVRLTARAGTGKSFACREGIWRLLESDPSCRARYVAFNRAIANDFQADLPPGAVATTMHSAGFAAIRASFPGIGEPDRRKVWRHIDALMPKRDGTTRKGKAAATKLASLCKSLLIDDPTPDQIVRLSASFGVNVPFGLKAIIDEVVPALLKRMLADVTTIDFDDMVWLPVKLGLDFPAIDVLFCDESQDLSPVQHALIQLVAGNGRVAMVGDPKQAIYSFRGADSRSMDTLSDSLSVTPRGLIDLPLTMTRRCPRSHVKLVNGLVPDFEALSGAKGGRIDSEADHSVLEPGVMTLCRTNAPLVSLAFKLVGGGVPVAIQGKDLGEGLARLIESFDTVSACDLTLKVHRHRNAELLRLSEIDGAEEDVERLNDTCSCIEAASVGCSSTSEVVDKVRSLFIDATKADQEDCVLLSSVHRAKGREAQHVAIIEPKLLPHPMAKSASARDQELNLGYVASTRSLFRLSFLGPIPDLYGA